MIVPAPKPPVHDVCPAFLAWLRRLPCWACQRIRRSHRRLAEAAHIESCRYGDAANAIPLCGWHHRDGPAAFHQLGRRGFETYWNVDLPALALVYWERFQVEQAGVAEWGW